MNVFISWSGRDTQSHKVAILLRDWLPKVIQNLRCFVSSQDIEAGAVWMRTLFAQLEQCSVGIICLTKASIDRPWIFFEAGAVAKKFEESRVCPLLIDLQQSDVRDPLAAFICKKTTKEDMRAVVEMINQSRGEGSLTKEDLDDSFENRWPFFARRLEEITKVADSPASAPAAPRETAPLLEELLTLTRQIAAQIEPKTVPDPYASARPDSHELLRLLKRKAQAERKSLYQSLKRVKYADLVVDCLYLIFHRADQEVCHLLEEPTNRSWLDEVLQREGFSYHVDFRLIT